LPLQSKLGRSNADYAIASMRATSAVLHYSEMGAAAQDRDRLAEEAHNLGAQAASLDVVSPISGVVLSSRPGDRLASYVPEGTELAEVGDLSRMRARIYVSEYDLYKLKLGSPARLMIDGKLRKWNTVVASIAPRSSAIDPLLNEVTQFKGLRPPNFYVADMPVTNEDGILKPGMAGLARIYGSRRSIGGLLWAELERALVRKLW
jgi:multidrug resistance efflux pump